MTELVITRGLPASGKTTWAQAWRDEAPLERARVNRDDLRFNLFGKYVISREQENIVSLAQRAAVKDLLQGGISVVVDDTHLQARFARKWAELAHELGVDFRCEDFDVSVDECIRRDALRASGGGRHVGEDVIRNMHQRFRKAGREVIEAIVSEPYTYEPDKSKPKAWLFDIDGTLALMSDRSPYDWSRVGEDSPNPPVISVLGALRSPTTQIVCLSGRDGSCRAETTAWLRQHRIFPDHLIMREAGDHRKDSIIKLELFREHVAPFFNVLGVFDDRDQVVRMWRSIGLFCAQVAPGDF